MCARPTCRVLSPISYRHETHKAAHTGYDAMLHSHYTRVGCQMGTYTLL